MMRIIAGSLKGKRLPPPVWGTRPTSDRAREMLFNILTHNETVKALYGGGFEKALVLDVFAGTGALGFEALSRGAQTLSLIENNPKALDQIKSFIQELSPSDLLPRLFSFTLPTLPQAAVSFNLIFIDPPYGENLLLPTLERLQEQGWIADSACIILETEKGESLILPSFLDLIRTQPCGRAQFWFTTYTGCD